VKKIKLKMCPFCGEVPKYFLSDAGYYFNFECSDKCIIRTKLRAFPFRFHDFENETIEHNGKIWKRKRSFDELNEIALRKFYNKWNRRKLL